MWSGQLRIHTYIHTLTIKRKLYQFKVSERFTYIYSVRNVALDLVLFLLLETYLTFITA